MIDTKMLQLNSLLLFAQTLGYRLVSAQHMNRGFVIRDMLSWHTHYISFKDMCKLHNGIITRVILNNGAKWYDFIECKHIDIPDESYAYALDYRLVEQVKLQVCKKEPRGVKCQDPWVKPTELCPLKFE